MPHLTKILHAAIVFLLPLLLVNPGCTSGSSDCALSEVFCVGLVTQVGRVNDGSYNQAAWEGIQLSKANGVADRIAYIETIDTRDYEDNIRVFAEAGYDVIVTIENDSSVAAYAVAEQYPDVYFIGADQRPPKELKSLVNLVWLVFPEDRLGFLAGAFAAAMTQTDQIGAVCGSDAYQPMKQYGDGFISGAKYINPEVIATVIYHNDVGLDETFNDPKWGATAANSLIDSGADIIFGIRGTTSRAALNAAAERGAYVIGADLDQYSILPTAAPRILTSVLKMISPGVVDLLQAAREAQKEKSPYRMGFYWGQIGFAPFHDLAELIPEKVKQQISPLPQSLLSGVIRLEEPAKIP